MSRLSTRNVGKIHLQVEYERTCTTSYTGSTEKLCFKKIFYFFSSIRHPLTLSCIPCRSTQKKTAITEKKKIPKSTFDVSKGTVQPSQKWKSLGLTDEKFYTAPQSPLKTASR